MWSFHFCLISKVVPDFPPNSAAVSEEFERKHTTIPVLCYPSSLGAHDNQNRSRAVRVVVRA